MPQKTKVNLTIDKDHVAEARALGLNMSHVAGEAIAKALKEERERRWKTENRSKIEAYNAWVEENGVPFADLRKF
ncbi:MAG: type II toxin-antitoxin system CcdA family antitoxin [Pseudomonadota bacterium]